MASGWQAAGGRRLRGGFSPLYRPPSLLGLAVLLCGLFLLLPVPSSPVQGRTTWSLTGLVVGISDGDTLSVMRAGKAVKVRLHGIDTPERKQAFGTRAKQFTSELAFNETVTVVVHTTDRYGRLVGEVQLPDGRSLNQELVRVGLAWWYRQYAPKDAELERLEAEARAAQRGLWSDPHAIAPWEFRAQRRHAVGQ